MAKKKEKRSHHKKSTPTPKRKPRQADLPGMEDRGIKELEDCANRLDDASTDKKQYAELEKTLNEELVSLMVKHGKTEYHHKSVHIVLPPTKQKAKVTIGEFPEAPAEDEPESPAGLRETAAVVHSEA